MSIRFIMRTMAFALLSCSVFAVAAESVTIEAGATHDGDVSTRNGAIRVGDGALVNGTLESRNGHIETGASVTTGDLHTRNGSIVLGDDGQYGQVESRNGGVELGERTRAAKIETRNGNVEVGGASRVGPLVTRNGSIDVAEGALVEGPITTRNGSVSLAQGSLVQGAITTRNGSVRLSGATAEQGVQSRSGDVLLRSGSRSGGNLVVEITEEDAGRSGGFFGLGASLSWPEAGDIRVLDESVVEGDVVLLLATDYDKAAPVVEIAGDALVTGDLHIDSRADLIVEGEVRGEIRRIAP